VTAVLGGQVRTRTKNFEQVFVAPSARLGWGGDAKCNMLLHFAAVDSRSMCAPGSQSIDFIGTWRGRQLWHRIWSSLARHRCGEDDFEPAQIERPRPESGVYAERIVLAAP
jgi:hypothetical protein